jgi:hypothetical protein
LDELQKRQDTSPGADFRLVQASLAAISERIALSITELASYRALAGRDNLENQSRARIARKDILSRIGADRRVLEELVSALPSRLQEHSRVGDVRRALKAIETAIEDGLDASTG